MKLRIFWLLAITSFCQVSYAKRMTPQPVAPVGVNGIEYMAPHVAPGYLEKHGMPKCPNGCLEAWDQRTGQRLWEVQVYAVKIDNQLERDVQEVFIRALTFEKGKLYVENERGEKFTVDLKTREVKKRWSLWK